VAAVTGRGADEEAVAGLDGAGFAGAGFAGADRVATGRGFAGAAGGGDRAGSRRPSLRASACALTRWKSALAQPVATSMTPINAPRTVRPAIIALH